LAWIAKDSQKDDAVDARKLAELLRLNRVHEVYYEDRLDHRSFKYLVVHYEQLSREQARLKSKIKARLRTFGIIRKDARLFSSAGQTELFDSIVDPLIKNIFRQSFAILGQMLVSLAEAKTAMLEFSRRLPEVRLLQTAPGVGQITACRFVAYVQTPQRFSNKRKLWRYARLGITRRESNGKRLAHPHLDPAGCGSLKDVSRKIFEAARRTKTDNSFKRFFENALFRHLFSLSLILFHFLVIHHYCLVRVAQLRIRHLKQKALHIFRVLHLKNRFGVKLTRVFDAFLTLDNIVGKIQSQKVRFFLITTRRDFAFCALDNHAAVVFGKVVEFIGRDLITDCLFQHVRVLFWKRMRNFFINEFGSFPRSIVMPDKSFGGRLLRHSVFGDDGSRHFLRRGLPARDNLLDGCLVNHHHFVHFVHLVHILAGNESAKS
jgi:hypothetical protein